MSDTKKTGLDLLRVPFPANLISKLPKGTKAQNECSAAEKVNCKICGGWHHPKIVHLDYVGHAALTDRLLDCDPLWNWEPVAVDDNGSPKLDKDGGMWIKLTVCGITRLGYGDAQGKTGGNATKERIGDALRNAAMRFGAALDLWSKADIHADEVDGKDPEKTPAKVTKAEPPEETAILATAKKEIDACKNSADLATLKAQKAATWNKLTGKNLIDCRRHFTATEKRLAAKALSAPFSEPPRHPCPIGEDRAGTLMSVAECLAADCKKMSSCPNWNKDLTA